MIQPCDVEINMKVHIQIQKAANYTMHAKAYGGYKWSQI